MEANEKHREKIRSVAIQIDKQLLEEWFTISSPAYEVYVSENYSKKHNIPCYKIDSPYLLPVKKKRYPYHTNKEKKTTSNVT